MAIKILKGENSSLLSSSGSDSGSVTQAQWLRFSDSGSVTQAQWQWPPNPPKLPWPSNPNPSPSQFKNPISPKGTALPVKSCRPPTHPVTKHKTHHSIFPCRQDVPTAFITILQTHSPIKIDILILKTLYRFHFPSIHIQMLEVQTFKFIHFQSHDYLALI